MKVSELSGAMLDYWVAKAEGAEDDDLGWRITAQGMQVKSRILDWRMSIYAPHRRWEQAGPIIEREKIAFYPFDGETDDENWHATTPLRPIRHAGDAPCWRGIGPTPLIAAMRAYVASKFGEEVDLP